MEEAEIVQLRDEELFHLFTALYEDLIDEGLLSKRQYNQVRYGIDMDFDLYMYFKFKDSHVHGLFREKPKKKVICVEGQGWVTISDFQSELEGRRNIMIKALITHFGKGREDVMPDYEDKLIKRD